MIVVDASAVLSVLLGEPAGSAVLHRLHGLPPHGLPPHGAPSHGAPPRDGRRGDRHGKTHDADGTPEALVAPEFLALEVANSLVQMRRRARRLGVEVDAGALMGVSPDRLAQSIAAHFEQFGLTLESFPSRAGFDRMCQIAERFGLSSYDALYVAFAEQRGARLLTLDRAMAAAAAGIGVVTITATGPDAN